MKRSIPVASFDKPTMVRGACDALLAHHHAPCLLRMLIASFMRLSGWLETMPCKGLVCNKTNVNRIAHYCGDETDNWIDQTITLGVELVDYQGKTTEAIRIKGAVRAANDNAPVDPVDGAVHAA